MKKQTSNTGGKSIEQHIGRRLRQRRLERGLTLQDMDALIGGTKGKTKAFEEGNSFVGPGDLFALAEALEVDVSFLFLNTGKSLRKVSALAMAPDVVEGAERLIKAYYKIEDRTLRRNVVDLLRDLAESEKNL